MSKPKILSNDGPTLPQVHAEFKDPDLQELYDEAIAYPDEPEYDESMGLEMTDNYPFQPEPWKY